MCEKDLERWREFYDSAGVMTEAEWIAYKARLDLAYVDGDPVRIMIGERRPAMPDVDSKIAYLVDPETDWRERVAAAKRFFGWD